MPQQTTPMENTPPAEVLVLGGGLSGCAVALHLADSGVPVVLAEKAGQIGGKVRGYGCKATDDCNNCGVCLTGGLFEKVENHSGITLLTNADLCGLGGGAANHTALLSTPQGTLSLSGLRAVVAATGFVGLHPAAADYLQENTPGEKPPCLLTSSELEALLSQRTSHALFPAEPRRIAFVGCFGTQETHTSSLASFRICCAYTTRAARLIRQYYPSSEIAFFHTESLPAGEDWLAQMAELGVEFIQSCPAKITAENNCTVYYDDPVSGRCQRAFDLVVLDEGIYPTEENTRLAELLGLSQDETGFLFATPGDMQAGLFVAGCARYPMRIEETFADAQRTAMEILTGFSPGGEAKP